MSGRLSENMSVIRQKEMRKVLSILAVVVLVSVIMGQLLATMFSCQHTTLVFLLITLLQGLAILLIVYFYFRKQIGEIQEATSEIESFVNNNQEFRLQDENEGSFSKLYHAINRMATVLEAQAATQKNTKDFLKETISNISHQLKTPLAALNMYNEIIQGDPRDSAAVIDFTAKTQRELDRMEMLILNLLKITRLDAGAIIMDKKVENISQMMNEIKLQFETRAKKEQKTILFTGGIETTLHCDSDWILEAISNIVKNALDHTSGGNEITVRWKKLPTMTQIIISDNGEGIHREDIHHVFKRFYRSKFSKESQGIGLGLALSNAIVTAHDGTISVSSTLGKGSEFQLDFLSLSNM